MIDNCLIDSLVDELISKNSEIFRKYALPDVISYLDTIPECESYCYINSHVIETWEDINDNYGEACFEAFQQVTMLTLMRNYEKRSLRKEYTDDIISRFEITYARIIKSIKDPSFQCYRTNNDILLKDLALCRQKVFPAGAQIVEPLSSFHRSILYRGGIHQSFDVIKLLFESGGNRPWYQIHTHLSELDEFNPDGWNRTYVRIAKMLEKHVEIKGMFGGSWFYDPALESISPRLAYLRLIPQENGAHVFYSNDDLDGGALSTSPTRRSLFEKGEYLPKSYSLIWPREAMIDWAKHYKIEKI